MHRAEPTERQRWAEMAGGLAGLGYWRLDVATQALRWSPNMFRIFGFEPGPEPFGEAAMARVHPDDRAAVDDRMAALAEGTPGEGPTRLIWPDGSIRHTEGRAACEYGPDGAVTALFGIVMDVTERHATDTALAEHQAHLALLADHGSDVIVELDLTGVIRYASASIHRYGYQADGLLGVPLRDLVHPDDLDGFRTRALGMLAGAPVGPERERTYRVLTADGGYIWVEGSPTFIRDAAGNPTGVISVLRDVTERHAAEAALAAREAHLQLIAEHTRDVVFQFDLQHRILYVSPAVRRYGYEPEELIGRFGAELAHPDDLSKIQALVSDLFSGDPPDASRDRTYRIRTKDGSYVWMDGQPTIVRDARGRPASVVTLLRDITQYKAATEALAQSETRYRLIADHTQDMIVVSRPDGVLSFVSPASEVVLGYRPEEMLGRRSREFIDPDDFQALAPTMAAYIAAGPGAASPRMEYRGLHKDGREVWLEASPRAVFDAEGRLVELQDNIRDITTAKAAQDALAHSEHRYRLLTENATDMIACYDARAVFTFLAPAVLAVMGYTPEEMVGRRTTSFMHPDDIAPVLLAFQAFLAAGPDAEPIRFEYRAFRKDGETVWLEAHPKAIYDADGIFVEFQDVVRDITERKRIDGALVESERRYRFLAENATDIVSRANLDGTFAYLSPAFRTVLGYELEEFLGRNPMSEVHPDDAKRMGKYFGAVFAGKTDNAPIAYRVRHKAGHWVWLEGHPTLIRDAEGQPVELIDVTRDVTARQLMEEELRDARDAAEAAAAVKSDFMANMSHEIRTPLTAVLGFSSLLSARADLDPTAREHAGRIAAAGRTLLALVNDVLDFSKLEAGRFEFTLRPVDPDAMAREALDLFTLQAESKGLQLAFDPAPGLPDWLALDAKAVSQVLLNLVGNAVKFSEAGAVRLGLAYDAETQRLRFEVRDTGPGLSPEQAASLFQRFAQVDGSSTRRHGGTGLGLAISKGLVEALGGEIGVDSVLGQGSTFHFTIPAQPAEAPIALGETDGEAWSLDGLRLLVVDDNPINRELVRAVLTPLGIEVTEAVDGSVALDLCATQPFDIVLLDIRMPGLDGHAVLARLRATDGPNQDVPILAFSAEFDLQATVAESTGFDDAVAKPLNPGALIAAIIRWSGLDPAPLEDTANAA